MGSTGFAVCENLRRASRRDRRLPQPHHPEPAPFLLRHPRIRPGVLRRDLHPRRDRQLTGCQAPCPGPLREPHQDAEEHRAGQAPVLRFRREPGLVEPRGPGREPGHLALARCSARRPPGTGLGHQTLALPALRRRRQDHHRRPPGPSAAARCRTGETPHRRVARSEQPDRCSPKTAPWSCCGPGLIPKPPPTNEREETPAGSVEVRAPPGVSGPITAPAFRFRRAQSPEPASAPRPLPEEKSALGQRRRP